MQFVNKENLSIYHKSHFGSNVFFSGLWIFEPPSNSSLIQTTQSQLNTVEPRKSERGFKKS